MPGLRKLFGSATGVSVFDLSTSGLGAGDSDSSKPPLVLESTLQDGSTCCSDSVRSFMSSITQEKLPVISWLVELDSVLESLARTSSPPSLASNSCVP